MRIFLAVLACLLTYSVGAQRYSFVNYTIKDGLAQSQVRDICQDEQGYLWIATNTGLSRFNGIEFVNYFVRDGLSDNGIRKLYVSDNGDLWVATAGGVSKFENGNIETYDFVEQHRINSIAEYKNEVYFACNEGLIGMNNGEFFKHGADSTNEFFWRSNLNYKDSVLICGGKEGLYTWDGDVFDPIEIPGFDNLNIRDLKLVGDDLYISDIRSGLFKFNLITFEVEVFELDYNRIWKFIVDGDEIFGVTQSRGAFLKDKNKTLYFNEDNWLMQSGLNCVFKDREGNIWIGTDSRGLMKFPGTSVVYYTMDDGLAGNVIFSIQEDSKGNFIYGTYEEGATRFQNDSVTVISRDGGVIADNDVWTILCDSLDHFWLGTSRGLTILDENNQALEHPELREDQKIRTMVRFDYQTLLMGGDNGLSVMRADSVYHLHLDLNIWKLYHYGDKVYCAASDGLYEFSGADNFTTYFQYDLPETKINTLTSDFQGNLWIGTETGLFIVSKNKQVLEFSLNEKNDRANQILGLITSRDSSIWASGMNGVYQIDYDSDNVLGYKVFNYGDAEGLIDEESNGNALYEDSEGNIWVGTASGLARIDPKGSHLLFDYKPPSLHITNLRLFMDNIDYSDYETEMDSVFDTPTFIELPHNKNHITFDFIGINLKDPEAVNYEYRLIGVDEEWTPFSKSNYATYSAVQPGEYTFQVRAMNKLGDLSDIKEVNVVIMPPFWRTWWFITLVIFAIFLVINYFFRSRIRVLKQRQDNEKLELKNRLLFLEQRSLNASMNRHFIFNSLNSIQYFINGSDKLSANRFLSNFAKLIRKNLDSSAANNFIVTLQEEIERIELYLSLEKMRFSDKFDYHVDVSSSIDTESIEIPSMILQPFVENSIIHGILSLERRGEIQVKVYQEFGEVVFEVIDNGLGIENSLRSKKNDMLGDHESRGVEITNRRIEILRKLTGENLLIIGPFQMDDENGNCLGTKVMLKLGGIEKFVD